MTHNNLREQFATDSQRYGNNATIDEVFEKETNPLPEELEEELAETAHLTEKEALAFVQGQLEGFPPWLGEKEIADDMVQSLGFKNISEYKSVKQTATEKVADAIRISELIEAYRFPDFPDECSECDRPLGGMWVESEDSSDVLCRVCADVDTEDLL